MFNDKNGGFSYFRDSKLMMDEVMGPEFRMSEVITKICDGDLPNVWGWVFPGQMVLFICKAEMLESIYVQ